MRRLFCFIIFLSVVFVFPLPAQDDDSLILLDNPDIYNDELFYQEWYLFSNAADKFFSMSSSDFTQELVQDESSIEAYYTATNQFYPPLNHIKMP